MRVFLKAVFSPGLDAAERTVTLWPSLRALSMGAEIFDWKEGALWRTWSDSFSIAYLKYRVERPRREGCSLIHLLLDNSDDRKCRERRA